MTIRFEDPGRPRDDVLAEWEAMRACVPLYVQRPAGFAGDRQAG
jgi:hypothetical protein